MSTSCKPLLSLWVRTAAPYPFMEAFWHFCQISSLLACTAPELGGDNPCNSTNPLSSGLYPLGLYQAGPCRGQRLLSWIPGQWASCGPSSLPWGAPAAPSHSSCSHCCLGAVHSPTALPCGWAQGQVSHLLLAPQSLVRKFWHIQGTCPIACARHGMCTSPASRGLGKPGPAWPICLLLWQVDSNKR